MSLILIVVHVTSVLGLALYGLLGYYAFWLYLRHKDDKFEFTETTPEALPFVTVQLPIFNEREVVGRLLAAVAAMQYPRERLEIQVLDDSTDDTTQLITDAIAKYKTEGVNINLIHRENRLGFKAGALQMALCSAQGEYIAIFDADFVPPPDFLLRTIPYLVNDSGLGVVQARWGHLNDDQSYLTGAQAIALDKHFAVEQLIRHRARIYPKFNGAAGVWRKACIEDSGGWQDDTVCEDLCLRIRAALQNWRFHYTHDLVAPAELPSTIMAYKVQQARWTLGATQCLTKYGRKIWQDPNASFSARIYALLALSAYLTNVLLLMLLLVQWPMLILGVRPPGWLYLFGLAGLGQPLLFLLAQISIYHDWPRRLKYFPTLLTVAIGISPSNTQALMQALLRRDFTFSRTPKGSNASYTIAPNRILLVESAFFIYSLGALLTAISIGNPGPVLLLASALIGFGYVIFSSLRGTSG